MQQKIKVRKSEVMNRIWADLNRRLGECARELRQGSDAGGKIEKVPGETIKGTLSEEIDLEAWARDLKVLCENEEMTQGTGRSYDIATKFNIDMTKADTPQAVEDCLFFQANPGRSYNARLATPDEIATLQEHGAIAGDTCFVHCLSKVHRDDDDTLQRIYVAAAAPVPDVDRFIKRAWRDTDEIITADLF
jgi:hypothetical protein